MNPKITANNKFIAGSGEMADLTRAKDWAKTSVGNVEQWSQSLRTILNIILTSKFPMFLFWGPELTCFYNDAYRPSLGQDGKHPHILGAAAKDAWPEIWHIIKPLIDQVLTTGEATWSEDQLIPIFRNGKLEDVYWTFSYSPAFDDSSKIAGVLVTCSETTEKVTTLKRIEESEKRFRNSVKQAPLAITILRGKDFVPEIVNEAYLQLVDKTEAEFIGKPLFDSLPEVKEIVEPLLNNVLKTGTAFHATELAVALNRYGKQETSYFNLVYQPLKEESNENTGIIVVATEVTDLVKAKHALLESEKQFRSLITQSPIAMTILRGDDHVVEIANNAMLKRWKKNESEVLGRSIINIFPEIKEQKFPQLLKQVLNTGKIHRETEALAIIYHDNKPVSYYLDFEYAPLFETDGKTSGIIVTVNDVTEKVDARKKVENAEERLRIATESTDLSTWDLDLQTKEIIHSPRLAEIFGYSKSKKIDHITMRNQVHPDDIHRIVEKAFDKAMKTSVYEYEARIIKPNKEIAWIKTRGKVFYNEENKPVKMLGTLSDITDERANSQVLEDSERKFRLLADSMPQFIWTSDANGNLNYFNQSVFNYSGLTKDQVYKEGWLQIVHPDDREKNISEWMESISKGKDFLFEHRFQRHDGKYHWQLSRAIPQRDSEGNIQMWVGTSTDIHNQKIFASELEGLVQERTKALELLNEELAKSEERYHLMVEEVQDYAILYLNREGIVENWNKGAEKIKGYSSDDIIGKSFSVFYTETDRQNNLPQRLLEQAVANGKALQQGWRVRKDKTLFWASVVITAVHNAKNTVIGFSKVTHDLTEKREADEKIKLNAQQLEEKNKELVKMNTELQSFAYVSSHDLQEPLRKIQTFASRLIEKEKERLSDSGKDYLMRMHEAANRMQSLIKDLLSYSRTNTSERKFIRTDLNEIFNDIKNEFHENIIEKNAIIESGNLDTIDIIPFQFRQLLHNLVSNSLKFSKAGIAPHIKVHSEIKAGKDMDIKLLVPNEMYCHFVFSDNGIGFDPQYKERIFEVFQRLHGKSEFSGTGIGLAIVKKIVEIHEGIIIATGEPNNGARFDIYIPVKAVS